MIVAGDDGRRIQPAKGRILMHIPAVAILAVGVASPN